MEKNTHQILLPKKIARKLPDGVEVKEEPLKNEEENVIVKLTENVTIKKELEEEQDVEKEHLVTLQSKDSNRGRRLHSTCIITGVYILASQKNSPPPL